MMWSVLKETFSKFFEDKAPRLGAALAFYTMFSLAPLLIIAVGVAAFFFDEQTVREELMAQSRNLIGGSGAEAIQQFIENARSEPGDGILASAFGVAMLIFGATGVFAQLKDALNTIWGVQAHVRRGLIKAFIRDRLLSFAMVLGIGFLLLVSLVLSATITGLTRYLERRFEIPGWTFEAINFTVSLAMVTLLFMMIYKILPDVNIGWSDVWHGALITSLLFTLGKFAIGFYLGRSSLDSSYGAAASLALILIWVYYSTQILFLGAEFTEVLASRYGRPIGVTEKAVPLTKEARARQGLADGIRPIRTVSPGVAYFGEIDDFPGGPSNAKLKCLYAGYLTFLGIVSGIAFSSQVWGTDQRAQTITPRPRDSRRARNKDCPEETPPFLSRMRANNPSCSE